MGPQLVVKAAKARQGNTKEVPLCPRQTHLAWDTQRHSCVRMCLNEIIKRLFAGGGLVAMRGDEMLTPSPAFASYMHRELGPFSRNAFLAAQTFGLVPVAFEKAEHELESGAGEMRVSPYVPKFGTYTITTRSVNGHQEFAFYWGGPCSDAAISVAVRGGCGGDERLEGAFGDPDDSVVIVSDFGSNPNLDGTLTSNLSAVVENILFHNELVDAAVTAERIASNPAVFTARNPAYDAQNSLRDTQLGEAWFAGSAARQAHLAQENAFSGGGQGRPALSDDADGDGPGVATYTRTPQEIRGTRLMLRAFERETGLSADEHFAVPGVSACDDEDPVAVRGQARHPGTGHVMPWSSQYFIGASRSLVHQQMPQTRGDLTQLTRNLQETVCGVLSVPRTLIVAESNVRAGVENSENTMNKTVQYWADLLGDLLTRVYRHMFGQSDLAEELRMRVEQKRRMLRARYGPATRAVPVHDLVTDSDLFDAAQKTSVSLVFDLVPVTSTERLTFLHDRGIISWKVYAESMLRVNNLPRAYLASEEEPNVENGPSGAEKGARKATGKKPKNTEEEEETSEEESEEKKRRNLGSARKRGRKRK